MPEAISLGRPLYHVVAPRGWMNDPCAPGYLPSGGFTLMYQWNPYSYKWDNISWGQVVSEDMVKWTYTSEKPCLVPDQPYDRDGVFTGSLVPTAPDGGPGLSIFYTSAKGIPIHWTKPHERGSEGVALATSADGQEWKKQGLVIDAEPGDLAVTGFRDPAIASWAAMDRSRGKASQGVYGVLSGGIQEGPCLFLYDIDPTDLTKWSFISTLGFVPRQERPSKWTGDFGTNWECASIFTLSTQDESRDICMFGVEGGKASAHAASHAVAHPDQPVRGTRSSPWMFVDVQNSDMTWQTAGALDWAELYAITTFAHPDGRRIAWGWIVEGDLSPELAEEKGWMCCLGIPRELSLAVYDNVTGTSGTKLADVGSFDMAGRRVVTLGISPLAELSQLRGAARRLDIDQTLDAPECYEIHLRASMTAESTLTLYLRHTSDYSISSSVSFSPASEEIVVARGNSTRNGGICTQDEVAPFTLLHYADHFEEVEWRVFVDKDVLEVFCNGRVAFATRLYSPKEANLVSIKVEGGAQVISGTLWEMGNIGLVVA